MNCETENELRYQLDEARHMADLYKRQAEIYAAERDHARACTYRYVQILEGIHALINPPMVTNSEGRVFMFRSPHLHEQMQALSDRIREIPDRIQEAEQGAIASVWKQEGGA